MPCCATWKPPTAQTNATMAAPPGANSRSRNWMPCSCVAADLARKFDLMTERKKLTLNKPADSTDGPSDERGYAPRRPPVRGSGSAPRARQTAEQAAKAREERAAREQGARPPRREAYADDRPPARRGDERPARRSDAPGPSPGVRGDERRPPRRDERPADRWGERRDDRGDTRRDERGPGRPSGAPTAHARREQPDRPRYDAPRPHEAPYQPAPKPVSSHDDGKMRLSKLMSERGMASRREADEWIEQGWVRVDGQVVDELGTRVFPDVVITVDPLASTQQAQRVTILLNKPIGYVSGQAEDGYEPAIVLIHPENRWTGDHLSTQLTRGHLRNLAPAGRLDIDSTGLLVLTQDGRVAKALIGEDSGVEKEYLVRVQSMADPTAEDVSKVVSPEDMERLRFGLELDGRQLKPAKVSWQNEHQLRFVLREGRKRQIRRMCEQVGLKVVGLKRVRMGRIALGDLPVGQWRFLRPDERF
ncbi:MAG: pseudouridine synthase [Burkholderiales bacterium]|nr:pseudouridine synthase [Burkholderiales bacterium]